MEMFSVRYFLNLCVFCMWIYSFKGLYDKLLKLLLRIWNFEDHGTAVSRNVASR